MKENTRKSLNKIFSAAVSYFVLVSALLTVEAGIFRNTQLPYYFLVSLLSMALGFAAAKAIIRDKSAAVQKFLSIKYIEFLLFFIGKGKNIRKATAALAYLPAAVPVLTVLMLDPDRRILHKVFISFAVFIFYIAGIKSYNTRFKRYQSPGSSVLGGLFLGLLLFLAYTIGRLSGLKSYILGFSIVSIFLDMIVRNQYNIDLNLFGRRKNEKAAMPENIRKINIYSTLFLSLLIVFLFYFNQIVIYAVRIIGYLAGQFILLAAKMISIIFSIKDEDPGVPPGAGPGNMGGAVSRTNPILNFIGNILVYFILMYTIYKISPFIIKGIIAVLKKIKIFIKKLFTISAGFNEKNSDIEDYSDEIESIDRYSEKRTGKRVKLRNADKADYRRITDPVLKIRAAFRFIMLFLASLGIPLSKADTAREINQRANDKLGFLENLNSITALYEAVRYGGVVPDQIEINRFIGELESIIKRKK